MTQTRCTWPGEKDYMVAYHDTEWGVPVHDDQKLFEMLNLEGAQAGLSWDTVLRKRDNYRRIFKHFDPNAVAAMTDNELEAALKDPGIIRNRLKVYGVRKNAHAALAIQDEFGSFDAYIWGFVNGKPLVNQPKGLSDLPAKTDLSDRISKDLKKRGFTFVGSTIVYAFMQATGMVDDHEVSCFCKGRRK